MLCTLTINFRSKVPRRHYFRMPGELLLQDDMALFIGWRATFNEDGNTSVRHLIKLRLDDVRVTIMKDQLVLHGDTVSLTPESDELIEDPEEEEGISVEVARMFRGGGEWTVQWLEVPANTQMRPEPLNQRVEKLWAGCRPGANRRRVPVHEKRDGESRRDAVKRFLEKQ